MADLVNRITKLFPKLPSQLRMAHKKDKPEVFTKKMLRGALTYSIMFMILAFFGAQVIFNAGADEKCGCTVQDCAEGAACKLPQGSTGACSCEQDRCDRITASCERVIKIKIALATILSLPLSFIALFILLMNSPLTEISRRRRELDREVLFAGRYLLVKIHSGAPLLNALIDASHSYGIASKYFKELVDDINMGTPIEKALDNAMNFTTSLKFRKILFQISNAIKIGIDVSEPLAATLDEISAEQMIEIQRYGKKLNSLSIFYMLIAVVMPSIGVAMMAVILSLIGQGGIATGIFYGVLGFLMLMQFMFVIIFKSARLTVNI